MKQPFAQEMKLLAAVKLFELSRLSSGRTAELDNLEAQQRETSPPPTH